MKKRFEYLDVLKAIAIIAVVLYHIGYMQYGYLGVDVFLVVNGFLLANAFKEMSTLMGGGKFLIKRILRLYPLTLLATGVCLLWGSYWMLPYQYQDLAQSVIATDIFANNILMSIKSADYWNTLNDYKPLMHTWYLGIIVQFYVVFSLIVVLSKKLIRTKKNITVYIVGVCLLISLALYLHPSFTTTQKFYFLPFRIFEFCAGCLTAYWVTDRKSNLNNNKPLISGVVILTYLLLLCLLFINVDYVSGTIKLLTTVVLSCVLLATLPSAGLVIDKVVSNRWLAGIGKASFSIYIWHQIVFAFCRYSFTSVFDIKVFLITILITAVLSVISYFFVEQSLSKYMKKEKGVRNTLIGCACAAIALIGISLFLNSRSGVIRDVPELDTYVGKTSDRMHIAYNEEGYQYDKDYISSDKLHWAVVGDSFGRDFVNILREMNIENQVEIAYIGIFDINKPEKIKRIKESDMIFRTMSIVPTESGINDFYHYTDSLGIDRNIVITVGSKNFGHCIGQVYAKRNQENYYQSTVSIDDLYFEQNDKLKKKYQNHYIDLITPVRVSETDVRVFTDNNRIISQDCVHLTQNGAKLYASLLKPIIENHIRKVN